MSDVIDLWSRREAASPLPEAQILVSRYPDGNIVVEGDPDEPSAVLTLLVEAIDALGWVIEDGDGFDGVRVVRDDG